MYLVFQSFLRKQAYKRRVQTHVQSDGDDVQGHCGVCHTTEGRRLKENNTDLLSEWKKAECDQSTIAASWQDVHQSSKYKNCHQRTERGFHVPSPDVEGAVSCVDGAVSVTWKLCSALSHCWTYGFHNKIQQKVRGRLVTAAHGKTNGLVVKVVYGLVIFHPQYVKKH